MLRNTKIRNIMLTAISAAVLAACGGGGGSSPSSQMVDNAVSARSVMNRIEDLRAKLTPEVLSTASQATLNQAKEELAKAEAAYAALSASSKALVKTADVEALKSLNEAVAAAEKAAQTAAQAAADEARAAAQAAKAVVDKIKALPGSSSAIDTEAEYKLLAEAEAAYKALSDSQKALVDAADADKLTNLSKNVITDSNPLPALNLPTPLHTSFIESATAQQNNPNVQLREIDGSNAFTYDQGGVLSSLEHNPNAEVKLDGVVVSNSTKVGDATQVNWTTPPSLIVKAFSGGYTKEDVSEQEGLEPGTKFALGKYTRDGKIVETYKSFTSAQAEFESAENKLEEAEAALEKAKTDELNAERDHRDAPAEAKSAALTTLMTAREKVAAAKEAVTSVTETKDKAKKEKDASQKNYDDEYGLRQYVATNALNAINQLAYFKKDKNGLVFDKKFDGVYIVQFTDGTRITLHDPAAAGWTYQTFAHYTDPKNGVIHGYQSLGDETAFAALPTSGTATYKGLTTAYLVQNGVDKQMTADVNAVVDFAKKGVRFATSNAQTHSLDNKGVRTSQAAAGYNISGTAKWSNGNQFTGKATTANGMSGDLNGKFYGAGAAEIGGTYGLKNAKNTEQLIGGYGAKRQ